MSYSDEVIEGIRDEMRLRQLIEDIIAEGNASTIKPQILAWYYKNTPHG